MNGTVVSLGALSGALAAARIDLAAFIKVREKDPKARFDFVLALARWAEGAVLGALPGLGYNAIA